MSSLNFHVRHEVKPDRVWGVLEAMAEGFEYDHITQSNRQLSRLRKLGLVADGLTSTGEQIYRLGIEKPEVLGDILHFIHYRKWNASNPLDDTTFYTYRAYCDLLCEKTCIDIDHDTRQEFTAELNGKISAEFVEHTGELAKGAVSLSTNSLRGVEHWLCNLSPVAIEEGTFTLRQFCVSELFLLALGFVIAQSDAELGVEQLMTPERRETICNVCLLDEDNFDQTLDWCIPAFPSIIQPGTSAGSYGRFIRMLKIPTIEDIIR